MTKETQCYSIYIYLFFLNDISALNSQTHAESLIPNNVGCELGLL